jgi:hypothetical protein
VSTMANRPVTFLELGYLAVAGYLLWVILTPKSHRVSGLFGNSSRRGHFGRGKRHV